MPVPSAITDLSTTAASNSPAGAESARGTIDDYLRAHASFIAQTRAGTSATTYTYSATGARIQADFSNATVASRTFLQDKTTNNASSVGVIPNGTGAEASVAAFGASDPANATYLTIASGSTYTKLESGKTGTASYAPLLLSVGGAEKARLLTDGALVIGTTSVPTSGGHLTVVNSTSSYYGISTVTVNNAGTYYFASFKTALGNSPVGQITSDGSTTVYASLSDYRLKENIQTMTGALAKVLSLSPVTYTWKSSGQSGQGFIAHELQAIIPDAVSGTKDATDDEGNPRYQGVDPSFVVATLTAAIKEQQALITSLTARVAALEAA